jgi:hypothetical protein
MKIRPDNLTEPDLIEFNLLDEGDKEENSQKICVKNAINHLQQTINGIKASDLQG